MRKRDRRYIVDEPNMSERTIITNVEDLICTAFGPTSKNTVNFKLIQTILHILARQLRLLEQDVEIKFDELGIDIEQAEKDAYGSGSSEDEDGRGSRKKGRGEKGGKGEKKKDGKGPRGKHDDRKGTADESAGITVTGRRPARVGSIEVVTASEFALLERAVKQLQQAAGPLPVPALPDNEQLRKDLAQGRASLSDTMQAVQLNARVQAAERGLSRMAELLTQLAKAGALPPDLAARIGQMQAELNLAAGTGPGGAGKGRGGASSDQVGSSTMSRMTTKRSSIGSATDAGAAGSTFMTKGVTHQEMNDVLEYMKEALIKEMNNLTARANHSADVASNTSRSVAQKLDVALQIDARINNLFEQTSDYSDQLSGFDSGLTTQMTSFQEQMTLMRKDLTDGLTLLDSANNNAETAAIIDLTERYASLVIELDNTVDMHQHLSNLQQQLSDELRSLVECVEMLREQKADRDEVLDGLRDKADISRLAGLLYEKDFTHARHEIENRLVKCYDKFNKQDQVWQTAIGDLTLASEMKAEIITLMALKESATQKLNEIQEKLRKLEIMLGEPKAALLMRELARDAACGACLTPAMMPPEDATHGKPCALPALRPAPLGAEDVCLRESKLVPPDTRDHTCHRWVGGSHTLVDSHVAREKARQANLQAMPTKKFEGYGTDGRMYMMEDDMQPCAECNKWSTDATPSGGGGDQAGG